MDIKRHISIFLLGLLPLFSAAQPFAVLPEMEGMSKGVLPNGTSYYVFQNTSSCGIADFALVQKIGYSSEREDEKGKVKTFAKKVLSCSERLKGQSPQELMLSYGAIPKDYGYVRVEPSSTIYWFDDVPVSGRAEILDSTLLVIFDMIDRMSGSGGSEYSPENQAVVISGDVAPDEVIQKMHMLSMMTSSSPAAPVSSSVQADSSDAGANGIVYFTGSKRQGNLSDLCLEYEMDRIPQEYMNSVFPAITDKYIRKLGIVAKRRIRKMMEYDSIPYTSLETSYVSSITQEGPEKFSVSMKVRDADLLDALEIAGLSLSTMSRGQISMGEQKYASGVFFEAMYEWAINPIVLNSSNVERAVSAFLYGAPLSSPHKEMEYLTGRSIPDTLECKLLNNFASAIISRSGNLSIKTNSTSYDEHEMDAAFGRGWYSDEMFPQDIWKISGEIDRPAKSQEKIKLRHRRTEPVTGGDMWTFSNGMKVIYKQMPVGDRLHASLAINRGYASLDDLSSGEGALMNEMIGLYDIDGLPYEDFSDLLYSRKMSIHYSMGHSSTSVDVNSPADSLASVIDILRSVAYSRHLDKEAASYKVQCDSIRHVAGKGGKEDRAALIDSIMCPSSPYSPFRNGISISDGLMKRADDLLDENFDNLSDGMLVFISSMEPESFRKKLTPLLTGFRAGNRNVRLSQPSFQPPAGSSTYTVKGDEYSGTVVISAKLPLTSENYVLSELASLVLQERLISSLIVHGVNVKVSTSFRKVPQERFNLFVSLSPVDEGGFVDGTVKRNPLEVLSLVRKAFLELPSQEEVERYLPMCKLMLKSRHEHMKTYPSFYIATIKTRYLEGKDLYSKYEACLDSADSRKVMGTYEAISSGAMLEYMVYN